MLHATTEAMMNDERPDRRGLYLSMVLAGLVLIVFGQAITFDFLSWDDQSFVVPHIHREGGLTPQSVRWALTNDFNGWRTPLPYLTYFAEAELWGLNPAGYHLTNVLIHAASSLLLFSTLRRATGDVWPAAGAAVLFAIHPLHVEPVAWVTGRWELLCGFFWILAMGAYVNYARTGRRLSYACVLIGYICALMSKPMALTLPFALLLLDYWPLRRWPQPADNQRADEETARPASLVRLLVEKAPLFAIMIVGLSVAYSAKTGFLERGAIRAFPLPQRLAGAIETYAVYTLQFFWPQGLSFYYPHEALWGGSPLWRVALAGAMLTAVTGIVLWRRQQRYLAAGWFWYLGVFTPAIGLVQVDSHARADRYTYLPLIGLTFMFCWLLKELATGLAWRRWAVGVLAPVAVVLLAMAAHRQTSHWKNSRTLFEHALEVDAKNFNALVGLGVNAALNGDDREAERRLLHALEVLPGYSRTLHNLGWLYYRQGKRSEARSFLERAVAIDPTRPKPRLMLSRCYEDEGSYAAARNQLEQIVRTAPDEPRGHEALGDFLARRGEHAQTVACYRTALALDASLVHVPKKAGEAILRSEGAESMVAFFEEFVQQHPRRVDVADHFSWVLATHPDGAVRNGSRAVEIAEDLRRRSPQENRFVLDTLSAAYAEAGRFADARRTAERALQMAEKANDHEHSKALRERMALFAQGLAYRDHPKTPSDQGAETLTSLNTDNPNDP